jgi:prepilin-type N-terminal cleavage/methylation domain-containing protein
MKLVSLRRRLAGERGYSLVEMLTVMVIMGVVMGSLTTVFVSASNSELDMNNRFQAQLNARLALDKFRREVHCATSVTLGSAASPSGPLAANSIAIAFPTGCKATGTVTWCTEGSASSYGLYRGCTCTGATCTGGSLYVRYLTLPNVFGYTAAAAGSKKLPTVSVDFPVNVRPKKTTELYELQDNVVLRNGARA